MGRKFNLQNHLKLAAVIMALGGDNETLIKNGVKDLQQLIATRADELGISTAILCSRKDLEQLIIATTKDDIPPDQIKLTITQGWRLHCVGQDLLNTLKGQ